MYGHHIDRVFLGLLCVVVGTASAKAQLMIEETFTGYPEDALISQSPAGPALGLAGDWTLTPNSDFYVNRSQTDLAAGTGKAVYDRPSDDNGARTASRATDAEHVLVTNGGDVFYASFLIDSPRAAGRVTFELGLEALVGGGGGTPDFSFGMLDGTYVVGNGGVDVNASGGSATTGRQRVVVRVVYGDAGTGVTDDEVVTIWVDPDEESDAPVLDATAVDFLNRGGAKVVSVRIRGDSMDGRAAFFR